MQRCVVADRFFGRSALFWAQAWALSAAWASSGVPPRVVDGPAGCSQRGARQLCASKCRLPTGYPVTAVPSLRPSVHPLPALGCPAHCRIHEVEDAYYADKEVRWAVAVKQQTCSCGWWDEHTDPLAHLQPSLKCTASSSHLAECVRDAQGVCDRGEGSSRQGGSGGRKGGGRQAACAGEGGGRGTQDRQAAIGVLFESAFVPGSRL